MRWIAYPLKMAIVMKYTVEVGSCHLLWYRMRIMPMTTTNRWSGNPQSQPFEICFLQLTNNFTTIFLSVVVKKSHTEWQSSKQAVYKFSTKMCGRFKILITKLKLIAFEVRERNPYFVLGVLWIIGWPVLLTREMFLRTHFRRRHTFASLCGSCLRFASLWRGNSRGDSCGHGVHLSKRLAKVWYSS